MQDTRVPSLMWEDPSCWRATKPMGHNYSACALEPESCNYWVHVLQLLKPICPRSMFHNKETEKPLQWEARVLQLENSPCLPQLEKSLCSGVGHDWATSLSLFTFMHWRRKWHPTPVFLPGESQGQGSLVGCRLWGCTESDTTEAT